MGRRNETCSLFLLLLFFQFPVCAQVPDLNGRLSVGYRKIHDTRNEGTNQLDYRAELMSGGSIWRPWFGMWNANLNLNWVDSDDAGGRTTTQFISGGVAAELFHQSHFPIRSSFSIIDTRTDRITDERSSQDFRNYQFMLGQFYKPRQGTLNGRYGWNYQHLRQETLETGANDINNIGDLDGHWETKQHEVSATAQLRQTDLQTTGLEDIQLQVRTDHFYQPSVDLNLTNRIAYDYIDRTNPSGRSQAIHNLTGNSRLNWADPQRPLRGNVFANAIMRDTDSSDFGYRLNLGAGVIYNLSEAWSTNAEVGVGYAAQDETDVTSFQRLGTNYISSPIDIRRFQYNWSAGALVRNETSTLVDSGSAFGGNFTHGINRNTVLSALPGWNFAGSLTQSINTLFDTLQDDTHNLVHNGSLALLQNRAGISSSLRWTGTWIERFGDIRTGNLSTSLQGNHRRELSRYSSVNGSFTLSGIRNRSETSTSRDYIFSLTASYLQQRLAKINRLNYSAVVEVDWKDFVSTQDGNTLGGSTFSARLRNEFRYVLGLLEFRLDLNLSNVGDASNIGEAQRALLYGQVIRYF